MAAQLSSKLTMDGTQHNDALRGAVKELSKYKREVENTDKQLKQFKQQSQNATGAVNTFAQSWKSGNIEGMLIGANGAAKSLGGTLTKFGGWFGVAVSAGEVFNRMMGESQQLSDAVAKVQNQAGEGVNYFASCLARTDFSNFLDGLREVIRLAGEAADAMDDVGSVAVRFGWVNQTLTSKYNAALANARNPENSKEERLKAAQEAKQLSDELTKTENAKAQADIAGAMKLIRTELSKQKYNGQHVDLSKISDKQLLKTFDIRNRGNVKSQHDAMVEADNGRVLTNTKYGAHGAHLAKADYDKFAKNNNMLLSYAAEEINDGADSALATALQLVGGANMLKDQQAARQATIGRTLNKINKPEGGSGSGGGSTTKHKPAKSEYPTGSVGWYDDQISDKQKQIKMSVDSSEIQRLKKEIEGLKKEKDALENPITINIKPIEIPPMKLFDTEVEMPLIPKLTKQLDELEEKKNKATDVSQIRQINKEIEAISQTLEKVKAGKDPMMPEIKIPNLAEQYSDIQDKIGNVLDGYNMGIIGAKKAQEFIDELNAQLEALGLKPIKIHVESDAEKTLGDISEVAGQMGDAFSGLGEAMNLPELDVAGIISGTIASVLQGYGTATAQASSMGPWAWIAFAIAGMAQVAAMISQIHSLSGYAEGGVIQGRTTIGDYNFARVNAGEMILNTKQQNHLFKMIDEGRTGLHQSMGGEVIFRIHGKDLEGVRRNYNDKMNKIR